MQGYTQTEHAHVHELIGSVKLADYVCQAHNHRVATVTGQPIALEGGGHAHEVCFSTDSFEGHGHAYSGMTSDAIAVCGGHVHYLLGMVSYENAHRHCFVLVTLLDDPIVE